MSKKAALKEKLYNKNKNKQNSEEDADQVEEQLEDLKDSDKPEKQINENGEEYWSITTKKRLSVSNFKGNIMINLREFFQKDGKWLPTKKGISLNIESWQTLKSLISDVDQSIKKNNKK